VASGSDDGRWFVWEKQTGRLIKMLLGDEAGSFLSPCDSVWFLLRFTSLFLVIFDLFFFCFTVVNCVQCHPFDCVVATSGIDSTIKVGLMDLIFVHLLLFGFLILQHGSRSGVQVLQFHQLWLGEQLDQKFVMCWKPWKATNEGYAIIVKLSCKTTSPCCPQSLHIIL